MIELTTGVLFLVSSIYGIGRNNSMEANAALAAQSGFNQAEQNVTMATSTLSNKISIDTSNPKEVEEYLRKEFADTPLLVEIARCESSFRHVDKEGNLIRGRVNKDDVGVMQINEKYHGKRAEERGIDLHSFEGNIEYAKRLYADSGGQPWVYSSKCWAGDMALK